MSKQRIILRADASKRIGFGHFIRSLALANHLKDDFDCVFVSYNEDEDYGHPSDFQLELIREICNPLLLGIIEDLDFFNKAFLDELTEDDIVVLDNYYYETSYQKKIKSKGCKLICIDDMPNRHFVCDVLITGTPYYRSDFSLEPYTDFRSGIKWFFLRDAFLRPLKVRKYNFQISNIVIAMGGSDALNLTDKIIKITRKVLPKVDINVIIGSGVQINSQGTAGITVHRNLSADEIVKLYEMADVALLPASSVSIEALSRGVKVFAGHYVDNQRKLYNFGVNKGYYIPLGNLLDPEDQLELRLSDAINRKYMYPQITCFQNQKERTLKLFKSFL